MPRTFRLIWVAAVCIFALGSAIDAQAAPENQRRGWVKKYDTNDDHRLKGKEVKNFWTDHEEPYKRLQAWCEGALEKPKKEGVDFPKGEKEKKFKCKKKRIDAPYLKAWVALAKPDKPTEREQAKVDSSVSPIKEKPHQPPANPCNPCSPPDNPCNPCGPPSNPCE